jgi:hypothetical protein
MPNMVETQIVHNHRVPIIVQQFFRHMARHIIVHLGEILQAKRSISILKSM